MVHPLVVIAEPGAGHQVPDDVQRRPVEHLVQVHRPALLRHQANLIH